MVVHGFLVRKSEVGVDERMLFEATPEAQLLLHRLNQKFDTKDHHFKKNAKKHSSSADPGPSPLQVKLKQKSRTSSTNLQGVLDDGS